MSERSQGEFGAISVKIDQVREQQSENSSKISEIKDGLYNPEKGVYTQVKDIRRWANEHEKSDQVMREEVHELHEKFDSKIEPLGERLALMEQWQRDHEDSDKRARKLQNDIALSLDGGLKQVTESIRPLAEDFKVRQSRKKWTDKIIWTILSTMIVGAVPAVWSFIKNQSKVEVLEKKMTEKESDTNSRSVNNEIMERLLEKMENIEKEQERRDRRQRRWERISSNSSGEKEITEPRDDNEQQQEEEGTSLQEISSKSIKEEEQEAKDSTVDDPSENLSSQEESVPPKNDNDLKQEEKK